MSGIFNSDRYDEIMKKYRENHRCCPKCGAIAHSTTLMAYLLDWSNPDNYKDKNRCDNIFRKLVNAAGAYL